MSYTPESQHLVPSIQKMREGIKDFQQRAQARIDNPGEWNPVHLAQLTEVRQRLIALDADLSNLEHSTQ